MGKSTEPQKAENTKLKIVNIQKRKRIVSGQEQSQEH